MMVAVFLQIVCSAVIFSRRVDSHRLYELCSTLKESRRLHQRKNDQCSPLIANFSLVFITCRLSDGDMQNTMMDAIFLPLVCTVVLFQGGQPGPNRPDLRIIFENFDPENLNLSHDRDRRSVIWAKL